MTGLGDRIEACLAAQERCEQLRAHAVRAAGRGLCDLAYANPYDGAPAPVRAAIASALGSQRPLGLQYTPYGGTPPTRRLVARELADSHVLPFTWRQVVLTPGATAALNLALRAVLREPGRDEVVIVTPCWLDVPLYAENLGLQPLLVPVHPGTLRLDLDALGAAIGPRTRAVVLSQPANPTGILYGADELRALAGILDACPEPPLLVSDECHRDFLFGAQFVSPAAFYDSTCVVHSYGKRFFVQGQRIGYAAVSPRMPDAGGFALRLERLCRVMGFSTPTALMQAALRRLVRLPAPTGPFAARRERACAGLRGLGIELEPGEATFFLYPRTPGGDDFAFAERLAELGVLVLPAPVFHHRGHFRISLTCSDAMLDAALDRLGKLL